MLVVGYLKQALVLVVGYLKHWAGAGGWLFKAGIGSGGLLFKAGAFIAGSTGTLAGAFISGTGSTGTLAGAALLFCTCPKSGSDIGFNSGDFNKGPVLFSASCPSSFLFSGNKLFLTNSFALSRSPFGSSGLSSFASLALALALAGAAIFAFSFKLAWSRFCVSVLHLRFHLN